MTVKEFMLWTLEFSIFYSSKTDLPFLLALKLRFYSREDRNEFIDRPTSRHEAIALLIQIK